MANTIYNATRVKMQNATFNWTTGTKRLILLTSAYTFDATDALLSDISAGFRVGSPVTLTTLEISTTGWACSLGAKFTALTGSAVYAVLIVDGATESAVPIVYLDTLNGLPFVPDGRDRYVIPTSLHTGATAGTGGWYAP